MSFNRRQFLLGTAAGLVLPSFFDKAFAYFENHEEPFLEAPRSASTIMYACAELDGGGGYQMTVGDPWMQPPDMTVKEFCDHYGETDPELDWMEGWCSDSHGCLDMNAVIVDWRLFDSWLQVHAPYRHAHEYLQSIDLGPQLSGGEAVGALEVQWGMPGSDYVGTHAVDAVTLSLLQNRLTELRSGYRVVVYEGSSLAQEAQKAREAQVF
jgi:hypothetical protein